MSELSASVLSADLSDLAAECRRTKDCGVNMIHFDVMDGHFVPNISYGAPVLKCLKKAVPDMVYDVHLMISEPARYAPDFAKAGADYITFHYEAVPDAVDKTITAIRETGCKAGLSINPGTDPQVIFPWLDKLDLVLVMGVNPGFGGQSFMPATPERIAAIKAECVRRGLSPRIEVDGGVNAQTGALCADAGADLLVMGSAFYGAKDPAALAETVREL